MKNLYIRTFQGSNDDMSTAIAEAEKPAQILLDSLSRSELVSVQAQSFVDRYEESPNYIGGQTYFHIITVVYE